MNTRTISLILAAPLAVACSSPAGPETPELPASSQVTTQAATITASAVEKSNYLANYVKSDAILHSFHAAEGMWVDCVDVNRQPSMLTPEMAGKGGRSATTPTRLADSFGCGTPVGSARR